MKLRAAKFGLFRDRDEGPMALDQRGAMQEVKKDDPGKMADAAELCRGAEAEVVAQRQLSERSFLLSESQRIGHIGTWSWEVPESRIVWSDEAYRLFGVSPESFVVTRASFLNLIHPEDRVHMEDWIKACLAGEEPRELEFRIILADGGIRILCGRGEFLAATECAPARMVGTVQDFTERRHAEDALRASEERFKLSMEATNDGLWDWDIRTDEVYYSPAYYRMLGYEAGGFAAKGSSWKELIHPEDRQRVIQTNMDCVEGRCELFEVEYRLRARDGGWRWVLGRGKCVARDKEGRALRLVGTHVDMTERKRLEEAIERRLVALTRLLGSAEGITFDELFDLATIQRLQDEFSAATGVASIITHPDGTPITRPSNFCQLCEGIIRCTAKGRLNCYRSDAALGRQRAEGPVIQPCLSGGLWDAGASITVGDRHIANWLIGQVRDETQSEEKMRAYAHAIGADETEVVEAFSEVPAMSLGQFKKIAQVLFTLANQLSASAYQNIQQARFITERKQVEESLRAAKTAAETATRVKDQFLAKLSHELRTPLTPVLLAVSRWQSQADLPAPLRESLQMVSRNLDLEARLLDDLLDVSRIQHGKLSLRREVVPVHKTIKEALAIVGPAAELKGIKLEVQLRAGKDRMEGDPARVEQILWNLLNNAIKFTPAGGSVSVTTGNESDREIWVEVTDSGAGMDRELLAMLFEPFEQGGVQINREYGGLGLGLTICRSLVEAHGGSIMASSAGRGKGATFKVRLPLTDMAEVVERTALVPPRARVKADGALRILLVEDHVDTARMLSRLLRAEGYEIETAGGVGAALERARRGGFDLLISDMGLPDGTGLELMEQLVVTKHAMKAIAVSGYGMEEDIRRSREAGFAEHVVKPISLPQLLATIERVMGRRAAKAAGE